MDNIQIFTNQLFGNVRSMVDEFGNPWFVGNDVATCLGYSNTRDALFKHVEPEDKNTVAIHDGIPGNPNMTIINESGLYSLIFSSKLPAAKQFKHWVTSEVLPAMRKIGFSNAEQMLKNRVAELEEQVQAQQMNTLSSGLRAADQSEMRGQMIEKIRSTPDGTPLTPELKQYFIVFDPNWEG